jgi:hypothetical protein
MGPIDLASPSSELLLLHDVVVAGSGGWSSAGRRAIRGVAMEHRRAQVVWSRRSNVKEEGR